MKRSDGASWGDRFGFAVFLSVCVHALVILGSEVSLQAGSRADAPLDIAIVGPRGEESPPEFDFRVRENQAGRGSPDAVSAAAGARGHDRGAGAAEEVPSPRIPREEDPRVEMLVAGNDIVDAGLVGESGEEAAADDIGRAIADLRARLDQRRQAYAGRPRTYAISSASTRNSHDASYLDYWRRRVEAVGNSNYPAQAERRRLYGSLRLLVAQMSDGSVSDVEILSSSGHELLDQSAVSIVRMAAPFEPFPAEMRSEVDILEIIRTWRFHEAEGLTSY